MAYVESYDDVLFWRTVLGQFEDSSRYFEIMLPTKERTGKKVIGRGKRSAIESILSNTGRDMIACVDADYDYLMQGATEASRTLLHTPYVFHTFAYSIENLQCYAAGLHNVCVMVTLNDHRVFDFEMFMRVYSVTVWPLFCWSVALYRADRFDAMTITDMDKVISIAKPSLYNIDNILERVGHKVKNRISLLRKSHPDIAATIPRVESSLVELGVTPETTYLYLHGHHLFEKVVVPVVDCVCSYLVREREEEIHRQAVHRVQMNNELSCYANSLESITSMLKKNVTYVTSPVYQHIAAQLQAVLSSAPAAKENTGGAQ